MTDHIFTPGNYTTRDGRKARVVFRVSEPTGDEFPLIGESFDGNVWSGMSWTANGHHWCHTGKHASADLMPPVNYIWCAISYDCLHGWLRSTQYFDFAENDPIIGVLRAEEGADRKPRRDRPVLWLTLEQARKLEAEG